MGRMSVIAFSLAAAAACQSFGDATTTNVTAPVADAGPPDDAGGSPAPAPEGGAVVDGPPGPGCRPTFTDDFERPMLFGGGWDAYPTGLGSGIEMELDTAIAANSLTSLRLAVDARPQGNGSYFVAKVDQPLATPDTAGCPIQISFHLRRGSTTFGPDDHVTFVSIELTDSTAIFLTLQEEGFFLYDQQGGGAKTKNTPLPLPPQDAFTRIVFRYDPAPTPPIAMVTVGDAAPVIYPTQVPNMGKPISVRLGASYATLGATANLWFDDVRIE